MYSSHLAKIVTLTFKLHRYILCTVQVHLSPHRKCTHILKLSNVIKPWLLYTKTSFSTYILYTQGHNHKTQIHTHYRRKHNFLKRVGKPFMKQGLTLSSLFNGASLSYSISCSIRAKPLEGQTSMAGSDLVTLSLHLTNCGHFNIRGVGLRCVLGQDTKQGA